MKPIEIAAVCHEANRAYCESIGDYSQLPWEDAPDWQRSSALAGVLFLLEDEARGAADAHESWTEAKLREGWQHGPRKDALRKEHPCMVPFHELPAEQRRKDYLFCGIVRALTHRSL
jgi:hypothetical protein